MGETVRKGGKRMKKIGMRLAAVCLALVLVISMVPGMALAAEGTLYTDIPDDFWAVNEIGYMSSRGYLKGKEDGTFCPTETITRKTVAMLLYRFEGEPAISGEARFTDVKRDRYYDAILWASRAGIVNGYANGTFQPDGVISRQHFAAMLYRYAQYKGCVTSGDTTHLLTDFGDWETIYGWAQTPCRWAWEHELITGRADGTFDPQGDTSRAQLAVIMTRFLQTVFGGQDPALTIAPNPVTQYPWDMDYSQSGVDAGWFDDVLFIGDSRTVGLRDYARSGNADYFCTVGLNVYDAPYEYTSDRNYSYTNLSGLLSSKTYGKIFINLGINECGYPRSSMMGAYKSLLNKVRQAQPGAKIILMGILTCGRGKEAENSCFGPANLYAINQEIAALADHETVFYMDSNAAFADDSRYLPGKISPDGCHLYLSYYQVWADWISYAAKQMGL